MWKTPGVLVAIVVCCGSALGQVRKVPSLDGHPASWWNTQLTEQRRETKSRLEAAGVDALPMLLWLLKNGGEGVPYEAAAAMTKLGPLAKPAAGELLGALQSHRSWWAQFQAGHALAAIGESRAAVREALLVKICTSDVHRLRQECAEALQSLTPTAPSILLRAVSEGRFEVLDHAVDVLRRLGEPAVPAMLASVKRGDRCGRVARETLVSIGWTVVTRLERAGHHALAQRVLRESALHGVMGTKPYAASLPGGQPPVQALPLLQFVYGYGHGTTMSLWRASECPRGFRVDRAAVVATYRERDDSYSYELQLGSVLLPRARALDMTRQLQALSRLQLKLRSEGPETWHSSGNFFSLVRATVDERPVLDVNFAGYPGGDKVLQRFRAEAARNVLFEAVRGLEWKDRQPVAADLQTVAAVRKLGKGDQAWWIDRRLQGLQDALAKALR